MARSELRIRPFLDRVDIPYLIEYIWPTENKEGMIQYINEVIDLIQEEYFVRKWENNPDLRFGQYMFNSGHGIFNTIYYMEEPEILMLCGWKDTESYGWISIMDKFQNTLETPKFRFIDQLDTNHLKTMVEEYNNEIRNYNPNIILLFEKELERRENEQD